MSKVFRSLFSFAGLVSVASVAFFASAHSSAAAELEPGCRWHNVTSTEVDAANEALRLDIDGINDAIDEHYPIPPWITHERDSSLHTPEYGLGYNVDLRVPIWTMHRLRREDLKPLARREAFRSFPGAVEDFVSTCRDYDEPVFDQGHMVPSADMTRSVTAMLNTYVMTNMAPRYCAFNRGIWRGLEKVVRHWAEVEGEIFVITGAIFDHDANGTRDADIFVPRMWSTKLRTARVGIASHFYKIVVKPEPGEFLSKVVVIVLPHTQERVFDAEFASRLNEGRKSLSWIEDRTGLEFFGTRSSRTPANAGVTPYPFWDEVHPLWQLPEHVDVEGRTGNCKTFK